MWFRTPKQSPKATQVAPPVTPTPQNYEPTASSTPAQGADQVQGAAGAPRGRGFFRRHPVLTVAGAAGVGLLGGIEMALGVAVGAGVLALIRPSSSQRAMSEGQGAWRERAQQLWEQAPDELRKRARAVVEAARGHNGATATQA
ncbi:MAG: hypothetical protein SFX73_18320 [Kofleriaceae bacterium]|nr:hypothetical protein [Kofleriaceae bacterium]